MSKEIFYDLAAREGLKRGVDALANAVKVTLGPKGRNVVIDKGRFGHQVTKDGVTVAKEIVLPTPIENLGAQMVKEVAFNVNELAGDGTTTATVIAQAIVREGLRNVAAGANPISLKRGIDKAVISIVAKIREQAIEVKGDTEIIRSVATVSANNDKDIGDLIAKAFSKVGETGVINVEEAKGIETSVEVVKGYRFNSGYLSQYFANIAEKKEVDFTKASIVLYDGKITDIEPLLSLANSQASAGRELVIIASDINEQSLNDLVMFKVTMKLNLVVIKAPFRGGKRTDAMEDIAALVGAKVLSEAKGHNLTQVTPAMMGNCERLVVTRKDTTIVNGKGSTLSIQKRVESIERLIESYDTDYEKDKARERVAKINGGIAILFVGATSEVEMGEKRDRVDDALAATRAAIEEGIVMGGGLAIIKAAQGCYKTGQGDEKLGASIIHEAVREPFKQIIRNGGGYPEVILEKILEGKNKNAGWDSKNEIMVNMVNEGIIDPAKVVIVALENAASVAGMILTTDCALIQIPEAGENLFNNL
jgi:chaperonin GroEL